MIRPAFVSLALSVSPASAHPHIFIEAGLVIDVNADGDAVAVEVSWTYDALYSLLIFEEFAVDDDYDGKLRPDELAVLAGFDLNWVDGFEGDIYVMHGATKISLGPPEPVATDVTDGKLKTTHRRALRTQANGLQIQVYDPSFYSAYDLTHGVEINGTCAASIDPADFEAATSALEELLFATPQSEIEAAFPEVGQSFADTVTIACE